MVIFHGHVKNNQMVDFDVFSICRDDDNALCMVYLLTKLGDLSKVNIYICDNMDYINMDNYG